ncbi:Abhydrolase family protein [Evansella caseinilytica]|uniref:Abhydrolase family protein n=1 Tax=Evansella caseinilytica TaxID=1503961 RepID=A0A1H3NY26_9BACI|nr:alpha/beta hydrolase family protein [Evansella caseinilytica]SDY93796.1 Abhydrolase family protein [Evansella caseinilytica]
MNSSNPRWAPDSYLEKLYEESGTNRRKTYSQSWQQQLKGAFREALGTWPENGEDLRPLLLEETDMGSYIRKRIELTSTDSLRLPVYLLIPKQALTEKRPAILAVHGHGYGSKAAVGLLPDGTESSEPADIHNNFAVKLVQKGFVVAAPELAGFGDRKMIADEQSSVPEANSCLPLASQLLLFGKTLPGLRIFECSRVVDYLLTLEEVDEASLGCMGFSGGGLVAAYTAVFDERLKATVISGYTNTFKGSILARRHCLDNYIPGILQLAEMPELIGLIAPRALFIESGVNDPLFPLPDVQKAVMQLAEIYAAFSAENSFAVHLFPGGHEVSGKKSFAWLGNTFMPAGSKP